MCQLRLVSHGQPGFSTFWATVARFFAVEPWCHCQLGRRAGAADVKGGKLFLLSNMQVGVLLPHHPCNLQQLRCPSDENV